MPLNVTGDYFKGEPEQWNAKEGYGHPGSDAEFYYTAIEMDGCVGADPESFITHAGLIEDLEQQCALSISEGD